MKAPLDMVQWVLPASFLLLSFTRSSLASLSPVKKGTDLSLLVWWVWRGHSPNNGRWTPDLAAACSQFSNWIVGTCGKSMGGLGRRTAWVARVMLAELPKAGAGGPGWQPDSF